MRYPLNMRSLFKLTPHQYASAGLLLTLLGALPVRGQAIQGLKPLTQQEQAAYDQFLKPFNYKAMEARTQQVLQAAAKHPEYSVPSAAAANMILKARDRDCPSSSPMAALIIEKQPTAGGVQITLRRLSGRVGHVNLVGPYMSALAGAIGSRRCDPFVEDEPPDSDDEVITPLASKDVPAKALPPSESPTAQAAKKAPFPAPPGRSVNGALAPTHGVNGAPLTPN